MYIFFDPPPDYGGIAKAAAGGEFGKSDDGLFVGKASTAKEFASLLQQAVIHVENGKGALVEAVLSVDEKGDSMVSK